MKAVRATLPVKVYITGETDVRSKDAGIKYMDAGMLACTWAASLVERTAGGSGGGSASKLAGRIAASSRLIVPEQEADSSRRAPFTSGAHDRPSPARSAAERVRRRVVGSMDSDEDSDMSECVELTAGGARREGAAV